MICLIGFSFLSDFLLLLVFFVDGVIIFDVTFEKSEDIGNGVINSGHFIVKDAALV